MAPAGTGYEEDLYAIPRVTEDKKHLLETQFMQQIDQKANDILSKMENAGTRALSEAERLIWATFLISLMQRSPEALRELGVKATSIFKEVMSTLQTSYAENRVEGDPETFEEFEQSAIAGGDFERMKMLALQEAILIPRAAHFMSSFLWGICSINEYQYELLTSDRPLVLGNGLGAPDGHFAFPIGPRKLFLATRTPNLMEMILMRRDLVGTTNNLIVQQAQRYVYGANDRQLLFVEKRLNKVRNLQSHRQLCRD